MTYARLWLLVTALVLVAAVSDGLPAQSAPATAPAAEKSAPAAEKPAPAAKDGQTAVREETIYIPYKELRKVFEKEGRGVFLPYGEFQELWQKARQRQLEPVADKPPVDFLISEAEYVATVASGSDAVSVTARLKIEILKAGWHQVPLRLGDAAITKATLGKEAAHLVGGPQQGYALLVKKEGDQPETLDLELQFAKAYTKAPGQNSVSFESPQAPVSRWEVRLSDSGVKVTIDPLIAATEMPAKDATVKGTTVLAFVGAAPTVRIGWTPKAEGATGLEALTSVQATHQATIEEGVLRTQVRLVYTITRAELPLLKLTVPADQKVVNVYDANVRQWSVAPAAADGTQTIDVQLFEPAKNTQSLVVELEKYEAKAEGEAAREVRVPLVEAVGVVRQQGVLVVDVSPELRAEVTERRGLIQVDAAELPAELSRKKGWDFAYRYAVLPYGLTLKVEKIKPRITLDSLVEARLAPDELMVDLLAVYTIERAGVFQLAVNLPADMEVRQVRGIEAAGAQAVAVDNFHVQEGPARRLLVDLSRKAMGRVALTVKLVRRLSEPDLLAPTGKKVEVALGVPRVASEGIEHDTGRLVVYAPETLQVSATTEGLRVIDVTKALELTGGSSPFLREAAGERPVLAYAYADEKAAATLAAERRAPQLTVRQALTARVEAGVVKYDARFYYDIRYGSVKTLRIDVPAALVKDKKLRNTTAGVREEEMSPAPADLAKDYVAWQLSGEKEFAGQQIITLTWESPIEKLDVGKSVTIAVPHLKPQGGRAHGQIILTRAEMIDLGGPENPAGLRAIDPQHDVPAEDRKADAVLAYEFEADWTLSVTATRYESEDVKRTSIERALVRAVITGAENASVQALYRMRSSNQRLALALPAGVEFADQPLRVNGRSASLEKGKDAAGNDRYFIPLVGLSPDEAFVVELRYTVKGVGLGAPRIDVPAFPGDTVAQEPATQKVYLAVYLPSDRAWLGSRGSWTSEQTWHRRLWRTWPEPRLSDGQLLKWVAGDSSLADKIDQQFQIGGDRYLFSALQPAAAPEGSLTVVSMSRNWMNGMVIVVIVGVGLLLLPARTGRRWLAVGAAMVLAIFLGVFLPTLARQLAGPATMASAAVVLILWALKYLIVTRPRCRRQKPGGPTGNEPAMVTAPLAPVAPSAAASTAGDTETKGGEPHA